MLSGLRMNRNLRRSRDRGGSGLGGSLTRRLLFSAAVVFFWPVCAVVAEPIPAPLAGTRIEREEWSILELQGKKAGFASVITAVRETPRGPQSITQTHEEFKIARMGSALHMVTGSKVTEDAAGHVVNFESYARGAGSNKNIRGFRVGNEMVVISGDSQKRYPFPADVIGPAALDRKMREAEMPVGGTFSASTFLPDMPHAPIAMTIENGGPEAVALGGTTRELSKYLVTMDVLPGFTTRVYLDDQDETVLAVTPVPGFGEMRLVRSTRDEAMQNLEAAEIFAESLIRPDKPLPDYRKLRRARYRISTKETPKPIHLAEGEGQTVEPQADGSALVDIRLPDPDLKADFALPAPADPALAPYLEPTAYIEQTPEITELARQAIGATTDPVEAARQIQDFVRGFVRKKDLSIGFASAMETVKSRAGDCTEHAVLCAALGRAVGLPTRVVTGLGYLPFDYSNQADGANGTFGFHMWAEANIGPGKWVTMDAALDGRTVGHLAVGKTALGEANPTVELGMPLLNLLQNLKIEVLETE
jgi:transglutaminase-like putative cysteine protease